MFLNNNFENMNFEKNYFLKILLKILLKINRNNLTI